jgi:transcriptional regulator with XRE-family HTH domain
MALPRRRSRRRRHKKGRYVELISAERLALLMREKGFGPSRLARYCGHSSHSYISRMMRGLPGAKTVTERTAELIAEALGVPVGLLFEVKEVKSSDPTRMAS